MKNEKKILIVEDEASLNNALNDQFILKGFSVFQAKNGEEGLEIALREHPDFILLDIIMPKMDGITMLEKLRAGSEWGKAVRVMILTNLEKIGKIDSDLLKDEVSEYLVKSDVKIEDIVNKVYQRLGV
jgi:DNA-binding response OmpR family regulator